MYKKVFLMFMFGLTFFLNSAVVKDVKLGFFNSGEKISDGSLADQIRCVIEFSKIVNYSVLEENDRVKLFYPNNKKQVYENIESKNKIFKEINFFNDKFKNRVEFILDEDYSYYVVRSVNNPFRLIFDFYRKSNDLNVLHREIKPRLERYSLAKNSIYQPKNNIVTDKMFESLFKDKSKLFLDLHNVPVKQVVSFFSKQADKVIVSDETVGGLVSLNIKDKTLAQAFQLFLKKKGYTLLDRMENYVITQTFITHKVTKNSYYSVYLNDISTEDMKLILDYFIPAGKIVIQNTNINKLDIFLPEEYISLVDSLVARYDSKSTKIRTNIELIILPKDEINFAKIKAVNITEILELKKKSVQTLNYLPLISDIHEIKSRFNVYQKIIKTGIIFRQSNKFDIGFSLNMQYHFARDKFLECDFDFIWKNVFDKKIQIVSEMSKEIILDFNQGIIIPFLDIMDKNVNYEGFKNDKTNFYDSSKYIPFVILIPEIEVK